MSLERKPFLVEGNPRALCEGTEPALAAAQTLPESNQNPFVLYKRMIGRFTDSLCPQSCFLGANAGLLRCQMPCYRQLCHDTHQAVKNDSFRPICGS